MSDSKQGYSYISVDDDDDDIVIQAGARATNAPKSPVGSEGTSESSAVPPEQTAPADAEANSFDDASQVSSTQPSDSPSSKSDERIDEGSSTDESSSLPPEEEGLSEEEREDLAFERAMEKRKSERQKNRMVTTKEDLHSPVPFAGMRAAILIIGIIAVILIVVYYVNGGIGGFSLQ